MLIRPTKTTVLAETRYIYTYQPTNIPHWHIVSERVAARGVEYVYLKLCDDDKLRNSPNAIYAEFSFHPDTLAFTFNQLALVRVNALIRLDSPFPEMHPHIEVGKQPTYDQLAMRRHKMLRK